MPERVPQRALLRRSLRSPGPEPRGVEASGESGRPAKRPRRGTRVVGLGSGAAPARRDGRCVLAELAEALGQRAVLGPALVVERAQAAPARTLGFPPMSSRVSVAGHSEAAARRGKEPGAEVEERGFGGDGAEAHPPVLLGEAALGPGRIRLLCRPPESFDCSFAHCCINPLQERKALRWREHAGSVGGTEPH